MPSSELARARPEIGAANPRTTTRVDDLAQIVVDEKVFRGGKRSAIDSRERDTNRIEPSKTSLPSTVAEIAPGRSSPEGSVEDHERVGRRREPRIEGRSRPRHRCDGADDQERAIE